MAQSRFTLSRRSFLLASAAAGALPLALSGRAAHAAEDKDVIVGTWGGNFGSMLDDYVNKPLMEPAGFTILPEISGPVPRRTKLLAERTNRRGSMDVVCLADFDIATAAFVGAMTPLDASNVPNYAHVLPFLEKPFSIPHIYSAHTIVYRKDLIPTPPASIAELWNPAYKGKIGLSDFLYTTNMAYAAVANGGTTSNFDGAEKGLKEWKELEAKILPSTEAVGQALASGDIWLTIISAARGYMWQKQGIDLGWVIPEEGAFPSVYEAGVPKNARNPQGGLAYVNAMLEPSAQAAFSAKMGYLPTVKNAKLDPDLEKLIGFSEAEQARLWKPDLDYIMQNQASMLDTWNRDFKG